MPSERLEVEMEEEFAELRALMNAPWEEGARATLWWLAMRASQHAPQVYRDQWVPYMEGFPHAFDAPLREVTTHAELAEAHALLPMATFSLRVSHDTRDVSMEALFGSPHAAALGALEWRADLGAQGARLLAGARMPRLRSLRLTYCDVGADGAAFLARAPWLPGLGSLRIWGNHLGDEGLGALLQGLVVSSLTELGLGWNQLGVESAHTLTAWPGLSGLERLALDRNKLGDAGVRILCSALEGMTFLDLGDNGLTAEGARTIAEASGLSSLETLDLWGNDIGVDGAKALASSPHFGRLTKLVVDRDVIGVAGAAAIASSPWLGEEVRQAFG